MPSYAPPSFAKQQRNSSSLKNSRLISDIITIDHDNGDASFILPNFYTLPESIRLYIKNSLIDIPTMVSLEEASI